MRQFAWYSPELNMIILQSIMEGCQISFEWDWENMIYIHKKYGIIEEPMETFGFIALGEL